MEKKMTRLLALDAMRGLTIALMIMVNGALWGARVYEPLTHSMWNGLTVGDLVFPWFMMIMGVSVAMSLRRYGYRLSGVAAWRIVRRTVLIFVVGLALDYVMKGMTGVIEGLDFSNLRIMGVLSRLALSYGAAALLALWVNERGVKWLIGLFLAGYGVVLLTMNGYAPSAENVLARVDLAIFGESHMYHEWLPERTAFDPEGLLGTVPSIAHVLIGYLIGRMLIETGDNYRRVMNLLLAGALMAAAGYVLSGVLPVNKKVWSPTFVLTTCGLGAQLLGVMIWLIDIKGYRGWTPVVTVFGVNPLILYVFSELLITVVWVINVDGTALPSYLYEHCLSRIGDGDSGLPSLVYSLLCVGVTWLAGYPLWKRRIYIRL